MREFKYNPVKIRLSKLLERFSGWTPPSSSEDRRISHLQKLGHDFRESLRNPAALGLAALVKIREERVQLPKGPEAVDGVAYLLDQLKHPSEVKLLRKVYGHSFVLIAAHATNSTRESNLVRSIASSENRGTKDDDIAKARNIITIDDEEPGPIGVDELGQNTRNTYPLADLFVNLEQEKGVEPHVRRFLDLLFGHPFHTPRPAEVAMYHASTAALRSSDESRQVGAVIVNVKRDNQNKASNIEVIATGMNEVPKRGGGFYWDGSDDSPDARDQWLIAYRNDDRALTIKKGVLTELLEVLRTREWFKQEIASTQTPHLLKELIPEGLKGTQFLNIGEFQRQVHAEMAALIDAARRGVAVDSRTMFVTTFPCHNCAKHIIAAGIRHVVYLEPYAKSRATNLHEEEIEIESKDGPPGDEDRKDGVIPKVVFSPYSGIAPRQYERLFSMSGRGKKALLLLNDWNFHKASLSPQHLVNNAFASYSMSEREELADLSTDKFDWDPSVVCPPPR